MPQKSRRYPSPAAEAFYEEAVAPVRNNTYGERLGRIRDTPVPMPKPGSGTTIQLIRDKYMGIPTTYGENGWRVSGTNAFSGGMAAIPSAGDLWAAAAGTRDIATVPKATQAQLADMRSRVSVGGRTHMPNRDPLQVAITRARNGMSLTDTERELLGMSREVPALASPDGTVPVSAGGAPSGLTADALAEAMAGSYAERKAAAKETVRQRGLARGEARAAARNYREMTKPRYVQGIGGVHVLPGTPPALAALQTMGGSSGDPIRDALLYGGPGAAQLEGGRLAADTTLRRQAMQNAADIQRAQILAAATANPAGATPAAPGGGGIIGTSAPPPTDAEFGLTPQQIAGLRARQGDDVALDAYIRTLKLEPWQARKLKEQYRQTFGQQIWGGISDFWRGPYSTAMPNELK